MPADGPDGGDDDLAREQGLDVIERVPLALLNLQVVRFRVPDGRSVDEVVAALSGDARVVSVQPNFYYRQDEGDAETPPVLQYALAKVDLDAAHEKARGRDVRVAVIDSGIDENHPGLDGAVLDVLDVTDSGDASPHDHGTAIAGIIRARGQVQGIAPDAELLSVRAFSPAGEASNAATTMGILRGIAWAVEKEARIINMSFSGSYDPLMAQGVAAAHERNIIMVAAAGNDGPDGEAAYPAAYDEVIAVTATDYADRLYAQANHGDYIAIAAPGVDVLVLALDHAHLMRSGTSFAAAHVSGILALMLEQQDGLTADEALWALTAGALDLGPDGWDHEFGAGRTDAARTLRLVGAPLPQERQRRDGAVEPHYFADLALGKSPVSPAGLENGENTPRSRTSRKWLRAQWTLGKAISSQGMRSHANRPTSRLSVPGFMSGSARSAR